MMLHTTGQEAKAGGWGETAEALGVENLGKFVCILLKEHCFRLGVHFYTRLPATLTPSMVLRARGETPVDFG